MPNTLRFRTVLLRSARLMSDLINEVLQPFQLNYSLWQVVFFINEHDGITSIDIAKKLNVSKPSIAKRVQSLMALNIIEHIDSVDKREKKLRLTEVGLDVFEKCLKAIDQAEQHLLAQFNDKDLETSTQALTQLISMLETKQAGD